MPAGWNATPELHLAGVRSSAGREAQWTLVGDRRELIDRLTLAGALVREVQPLPLEDAAVRALDAVKRLTIHDSLPDVEGVTVTGQGTAGQILEHDGCRHESYYLA